jgi:hypothetical protein
MLSAMQQKLCLIVLNFASGMTTEDSTGRERGLMGVGEGETTKGMTWFLDMDRPSQMGT